MNKIRRNHIPRLQKTHNQVGQRPVVTQGNTTRATTDENTRAQGGRKFKQGFKDKATPRWGFVVE